MSTPTVTIPVELLKQLIASMGDCADLDDEVFEEATEYLKEAKSE